ncbi:choline/ethanolamine transporter flvcr2b-like, partial [Littorina saxatilis]|uniref:choline/ethanolamine transporter flvcr2b-like n=1 Tax=Littorina saxatilis TaxID=31220 RepID=UPI0038B4F882
MPFGEALLPGENTAGSNQREILTMEGNSMTESKASPEETESGALPDANILSNGGPRESENDSRDVKCREQRRESISNSNEKAQANNQEVEIKTGTDTTKSSISDTMDTGDNQNLGPKTKQTTPAATEETDDEAKHSKDNHELGPRTKQTTPAATEETDDEAKNSKDIGVYKRRWYVLAAFCLFSFTQACVWNTFGPISSTTEEAFGWTDGTIALFSNWGPIGYILAAIPFSWMLDVKGLRWSCVFSAFLVLVGTALRCITMHTPTVTWLIHVGHFLNGVAGPVAMGGPPAVSAVWFPLHERATATAIGTACNYLGVAVAFILGPNIVHSYRTVAQNTTDGSLER